MEQLEGRGNAREMDGNTLHIMAPQRYRSFLLQSLLICLLLTFIHVSLVSMPRQVITKRFLHEPRQHEHKKHWWYTQRKFRKIFECRDFELKKVFANEAFSDENMLLIVPLLRKKEREEKQKEGQTGPDSRKVFVRTKN